MHGFHCHEISKLTYDEQFIGLSVGAAYAQCSSRMETEAIMQVATEAGSY